MTTAYSSIITQKVYSALINRGELQNLLSQYGETKFVIGRITEPDSELVGNLQIPRIEIKLDELEQTPDKTNIKLLVQVVIDDAETTQDGVLESYAGEINSEKLAVRIITAIENISGLGNDLDSFGYKINGEQFPIWSTLITLDFNVTRALNYDPDISQ